MTDLKGHPDFKKNRSCLLDMAPMSTTRENDDYFLLCKTIAKFYTSESIK